MTKSSFLELLWGTHERMKELTATKGEEYANSVDQLDNFRRGAAQLDISAEKVWSVLFMKHVDAITSYTKNSRVLSESIDGRIDDAILYLNLLKGMVYENERRYYFGNEKRKGPEERRTDPDIVCVKVDLRKVKGDRRNDCPF